MGKGGRQHVAAHFTSDHFATHMEASRKPRVVTRVLFIRFRLTNRNCGYQSCCSFALARPFLDWRCPLGVLLGSLGLVSGGSRNDVRSKVRKAMIILGLNAFHAATNTK